MTSPTIPMRIPVTANDLATHVARLFGQHMELGCRLTFDGRLDPDALARAVRLSLDVEPVLGCTLHTGAFRAWWERLDDLDAHVPFSVAATDDADGDAIAFQTATIGDAGPRVAVRLLRSANADEVVATIDHDVADGQGLKQYAYLLADLYSHLIADLAYVASHDLRPRPAAADVWGWLTPEQRREANKTPSMTMPNWDVLSKGTSGEGRTLCELRLGPERFLAAKAYGETRGATVNGLLLTAFFRAMTRAFPPPAGQPMSLPFTADHRRYLGASGEIPITNLAISIWLGVPFVEGEAFDGTLARVDAQLGVWRDALWGVKSASQATSMARLGYGPMKLAMGAISKMSAKSGKTSPVFTNIGILDEGGLAFGGCAPASARLSGPAAFGASLVPTISTYRDELTVSMGFCAADIDAAVIERVLGHMDAELSFA